MSKITREKISESVTELTIEVEVKEHEKYLKKAAETLSSEKPQKGFRPGKVDVETAKKIFGEMSLYERALDFVIRETLPDAIRKEKIVFVGEPSISVIKCAPANPIIYKAKLALLPQVTLHDYTKVKIDKEDSKVEENELNEVLDYIRGTRAQEKLVDRAVEGDDHVVVSLKIFLDNVPIDGGDIKDHHIFVGKDDLYPGVGEKVIGMKKNEEKEVKLTMPKNFWQKQLQGKEIEARVKVKDIYERTLPELTNDFAKSLGSFESVGALKKQLTDNIKHEKEAKENERRQGAFLKEMIDKSIFTEIPDVLIQDEKNRMLQEQKQMVKSRGLKWEDYVEHLKTTDEDIVSGFSEGAIERLKKNIVIAKIIQEKNIEISEDEIEKEWESIKQTDSKAKEIEKTDPNRVVVIKQHIKTVLANKKVLQNIV